MRFTSLSLLLLALAPACANTRWSVAAPRPIAAIAVAPAEIAGAANPKLVAQRRSALITALRARGYQVFDGADATDGVPQLTLKVGGSLIDDSQLHAPDDERHHIYNELHYQFVVYQVQLALSDAGGRVLAHGSAQADRDPQDALESLTARMVQDLPPPSRTIASR